MKELTKELTIDGNDLIKKNFNPICLVNLIALTSLWAPKEVVEELSKKKNNPTSLWYYNTKRRKSEKEGALKKINKEGIYLDDNSKANAAIKAALGLSSQYKPRNMATCHIYEKSTYDIKYHTSIPNLVLVPRSISTLTDGFLEECTSFLKYYSYIQYGFYIKKKPLKPNFWSKIEVERMINPTKKQIERALLSVKNRN